jgi:GTPase SAR1 family protein
MFVGLGDAGKTSLFNALGRFDNHNYSSDGFIPKVTDGIQIKKWELLNNNDKLTFSMWDFAGQSVYYNTHQFFLTSRAVYLLVWNVRLGSEYANLDFWLASISVHAPGSPIFVVGTHIDQVAKYTLDQNDFKSRFKQIVGFHFVSSYDFTGIGNLIKDLYDCTLKQTYIGETIPVCIKFIFLYNYNTA